MPFTTSVMNISKIYIVLPFFHSRSSDRKFTRRDLRLKISNFETEIDFFNGVGFTRREAI